MFHGITFYNQKRFDTSTYVGNYVMRRTWEDWHLIPTSRPIVNKPKPKTNYINTYAAQGGIDTTDAVLGYPVYDRREGSWEFTIINSYVDINGQTVRTMPSDLLITQIMYVLNGQVLYMVLDDDPDFYYYGRFWVDEVKQSGTLTGISIKYSLNPWKISKTDMSNQNGSISKTYLWNDLYLGKDAYKVIPQNPMTYTVTDPNGTIEMNVPGSAPLETTVTISGSYLGSETSIYLIYNGRANEFKLTDGTLTQKIRCYVTDRLIKVENLAVGGTVTLSGEWGEF